MSYSAVRKAWKDHLSAFHIRYRPLYATRHTFASLALAAGENPLWIAQVMGHSRPDQLFLRYGSPLDGEIRDGKKLEGLLHIPRRNHLYAVK